MGSFGVVVIGMWRVVFFEIVQCFHFSFPPLLQKQFMDRILTRTLCLSATTLIVMPILNVATCFFFFFNLEHNPPFLELYCIPSLEGQALRMQSICSN